MNADLERTLGELDAATRACAARLRAAPQARTRDGFAAGVMAAVRAEDVRAAAARRFRPRRAVFRQSRPASQPPVPTTR